MESGTIYQLTPVVVGVSISPSTQLNPPSAFTANCSNGVLTGNATISLPNGVSPTSVVLKQFYSPTLGLQFYFVYNFTTPQGATYNDYQFAFTADPKDYKNNPIPFTTLNQATALIQDIDPKTSRGTSTPITHNSEI
jgi:hypothetical protein